MEADDLRIASLSPYGTNYTPGGRMDDDPNWRYQTWREVGQERSEMVERLLDDVMAPADETSSEARRDIRLALQDPSGVDSRAALTAAYNAMCDAERQLRDNDSDESESNSDED